jgi:hypothetical protein
VRALCALVLLLWCTACQRSPETRCSLGEAALVTREQVASYDGIALVATGSRATALWSSKLGLFAKKLGRPEAASVRLDQACNGAIAAAADASGSFVACAQRAASDHAGSLWLYELDEQLHVRAKLALAPLDRDAGGLSLALSHDRLYVAYADGRVGGPRVFLLELARAQLLAAEVPKPRALSLPEQNAREPSLAVQQGIPVVVFAASELGTGGPRHRLMIARGTSPARPLRDLLSVSPLPVLGSDRQGLVLAFRDLPRRGARVDLYVGRLGETSQFVRPPRAIGRANGHSAASLALCSGTRAVAVPIDHGGELYVALHPLSESLETSEANHQYYESEREFVENSATCFGGHPLTLIAERSEANAPEARLLAAEFHCTQ